MRQKLIDLTDLTDSGLSHSHTQTGHRILGSDSWPEVQFSNALAIG